MYSYSICPVQVRRALPGGGVRFWLGRWGEPSTARPCPQFKSDPTDDDDDDVDNDDGDHDGDDGDHDVHNGLSSFHPARVLVPNLNQIPAALHPTRSTRSNFQFLTLDPTSSVSPAKRSSLLDLNN